MRADDQRELDTVYRKIKETIEERLLEFRRVWEKGSEEELFYELVFCLLTPGARARSAWCCVENLLKKGLLMKGTIEAISEELNPVRFKNNKARNIVIARERFCENESASIKREIESHGDQFAIREWLVETVRGMGYKEASHFLRNVGLGEDLAILDRHILKNLARFGLIPRVPGSLTGKRYKEVEESMRGFSVELGIALSHLDFIFWYNETGDIFK